MSNLSTPYNFVPAAPFVLSPEWAAQASHDHPFEDGLSGELNIELVNRTPLCVGGKQEAATEHVAGKVYVYRTPENIPAIAGSSLKGMLRNALAPVVFARMSQVEDRKLSVRDINNSDTYYHKTIVNGKHQKAGWLRFHEGKWQIKGCEYVNIHQGDIIKHFKLNENAWKKAKTVSDRYGLLDGFKTVMFNTQPGKNRIEAVDLGKGEFSGKLVVTGQPGPAFDGGRSAKKWEFVFYEKENSLQEWQDVPVKVLKDFLFVHQDSKEWEFFLRSGYIEIPVFYHATGSNITSMGLAFMYRLAQKNSLHDALGNISPQHLHAGKADFTELLFGRIAPDEMENPEHDWNLRGRVNIGLLEATGSPETEWTDETVLSSPKPSFFPAYLQQPEPNKSGKDVLATLDSKNPKLSGWKRYPVKPKHIQPPPQLEDGKTLSNKVKVRLETLKTGTQFTGKIRFHNLRPVELGALLWVLDFGGRENLCHALGMGKPYGLGQVQISVNSEVSKVVANHRAALAGMETDKTLAAARKLFIAYMDEVWQSVAEVQGNTLARWEASAQVRNVLAMANPDNGEKLAGNLKYLPDPKSFMKVKQNQEYLTPYMSANEIQQIKENIKDSVKEPLVVQTTMTLTEGLDKLKEEVREKEEKLQHDHARSAMTENERMVYDLNSLLTKMEETGGPKSAPKAIEKILKQIAELEESKWRELALDESLVQRAEAIENKIIKKAAKKVRTRLETV